MSNSVAPLPGGVGVAAVTEHRPRHQSDPHPHEGEQPSNGHEAPHGDNQSGHGHPAAAAPLTDDPGVTAETLFATTLFANEFLQQPPSPGEMKLHGPQEWIPPESQLRLRDKLI